jgi:hypothetical protein
MYTFSTGGVSVGGWGARMARIARRKKGSMFVKKQMFRSSIDTSAPGESLLADAEQGGHCQRM